MKIRDSFGIYHALEVQLKKSAQPVTCVDLIEVPEIRAFTDSVSRLSDYLGHMYRQGLLARTPAPKMPNSQARYAYYWKKRSEVTLAPAPVSAPVHVDAPQTILSKSSIEIRDDGKSVVIDLPFMRIVIVPK
jgi:hypothetical protein